MTRRLLLVGARPPPAGGIAIHLDDLERTLLSRGALVDAIDPRRDGPDGPGGRARLLSRLGLAALRRELIHVHANGHNRRSWLVALACALFGDTVLTVHSGLAPNFMQSHQTLVRLVCKRIKFTIAVSPPIARALAAAGVADERIAVHPAFSASSLPLPLPPPGLAALRRRHHPLLACAVVASQPEYGADVMLDAMVQVHQKAPAAGLLLYGPGTRDPAFAERVRGLGLARVVALLGPLLRERALAVVEAADLFVRPTRADGDALSVREALALGCPVAASSASARPAGVIEFAPDSPSACAEAIFHALGNRGAPDAPPPAPPLDCLPPLLAIYRRAGLVLPAETTGTRFAKATG